MNPPFIECLGEVLGALLLSGVPGVFGNPPHGLSLAAAGGVAAQGVATPVLPAGGGASVRYCPSPFLPHLQDLTPPTPHSSPSPLQPLRDPP